MAYNSFWIIYGKFILFDAWRRFDFPLSDGFRLNLIKTLSEAPKYPLQWLLQPSAV